jgi:hypothetical protein
MGSYRIVRLRGAHFFYTADSQIAVTSDLRHRLHFTPQKHILILISVRGLVNPRTIVELKRVGKLELTSIISSRIQPATLRLVA